MTDRYKDFDLAWAENASAPLTVKVLGKDYELPAAIPAKVVLAIARSKGKAADTEVPLDEVMQLLDPFFGPGVLTEWLDKGLDVDQLGDVFKWSMAMYSGLDPDAVPEGDEPNPNPPTRPTTGKKPTRR